MKNQEIKRAAGNRSTKNMNSTHVTTFEFSQVRPTLTQELIPNSYYEVTPKMLARTAPLTLPTYGNAKFIHRGFYVPYRLIMPYWEEFQGMRKIDLGQGLYEMKPLGFTVNDLYSIFFAGFVDNFDKARTTERNIAWTIAAADADFENQIKLTYSNEFGTFTVLSKALADTFVQSDENTYSVLPEHDFTFKLLYFVEELNNEASITVFVRLNPLGRFIIKTMESLGYKIPFDFIHTRVLNIVSTQLDNQYNELPDQWRTSNNSYKIDITSGNIQEVDEIDKQYERYNIEYDALKFMAYLKVIADNYIPQQFSTSNAIYNFFQYIKNNFFYIYEDTDYKYINPLLIIANTSANDKNIGNWKDRYNKLTEMFKLAWQTWSGGSYFTNAWYNEESIVSQELIGTSNGTYNKISEIMDDSQAGERYNENNGVTKTDVATTFNKANTSLDMLVQNASATNHKWLQSVYNWLMRKNFGGARAVENLLLQYGIKVPNYRLQYSEYLGKVTNDLEIIDVTQSATTDAGTLGEYGGKAYSVGASHEKIKVETKEHGVFILMTSLIAPNGLCQGIDRTNLIRLHVEDYYQPELERTGMQPIYVGELYEGRPSIYDVKECLNTNSRGVKIERVENTPDYYNQHNEGWNKLYGFAPRYTYQKFPRNNITGDFKLHSLGGGIEGELNAWHLLRLIKTDQFYGYDENQRINQQNSHYSLAQNITKFEAQKDILYDNGQQYNRIFNVVDNQQDHIFAIMQFEARLDDPSLPVNSSIDLDGFQEVAADQNGDVKN